MGTIAVLGGGHGALAAAAHLAWQGHCSRLFNRTSARLEPVRRRGGVVIKGGALPEVFVPLQVADSLAAAVTGADLVMLCLPATGHEYYAAQLAPLVHRHQPIFLNPGATGGALHVAAVLQRHGCTGVPPVAESSTLTYICRTTPEGDPAIYRLGAQVRYAVYPANRTSAVRSILRELYPDLVECATVLEPSLTNLNAVLHPPGMLMNAGWIEFTQGDFFYYYEGTTPAVAQVIEDVDQERLALLRALGLPEISFLEHFCQAGYTTASALASGSVYRALRESEGNRTLKSPPALKHRYLDEDVGFGLVPMKELADLAGVPMPVTDALITLAGRVNRVDYRHEGLTLARMGFHPATASLAAVLRQAAAGA